MTELKPHGVETKTWRLGTWGPLSGTPTKLGKQR